METIAYGYCQCGCGKQTSIAKKTHRRSGHVKGEPVRYIMGHQNHKNTPLYEIDDNGCWVWQRATSEAGYGFIHIDGQSRSVHRVFYEHYKGEIPQGHDIHHECHNTRCVNPEHLTPMPKKQHYRKARTLKLDMEKAQEIRRLVRSGHTQVSVAKKYGVTFQMVSRIMRNQCWI